MEFKSQILDKLTENRPNLGDKSRATYGSTLVNLPKKMGIDSPNLSFFDQQYKILSFLSNETETKRKSILAALYALTSNKYYQELMIKDTQFVNKLYREQQKSKKEERNWLDWNDILKKYNEMKTEIEPILKLKNINDESFFKINTFVLFSMFVLFPPRRVMDYSEMKLRNHDTKTDNYIVKNQMIFHKYKTFSSYGKQQFTINSDLQNLIAKWKKINTHDYLILNSKFKQCDGPQITRILNNIFDDKDKDKRVSANMIRHSYLTHFYSGQMPPLTEMEELAQKMGHSINTALTYIKQ